MQTPKVQKDLKEFVLLALDNWQETARQDARGELYRSFRAGDGQGFYVLNYTGERLAYWNHRGVDRFRQELATARRGYKHPKRGKLPSYDPEELNTTYSGNLPDEVAAVLEVRVKMLPLEGKRELEWPKPFGEFDVHARESYGTDTLWVTTKELKQLKKGRFPETLAKRIGHAHLQNTQMGEPRWTDDFEVDVADSRKKVFSGSASVKQSTFSYQAGVTLAASFKSSGALKSCNFVIDGVATGKPEWGFPCPDSYRLVIAGRLLEEDDPLRVIYPHAAPRVPGFYISK